MKVLLIDDSNTMRKIQKKTLAQMGYTEVSEAGNGIEALKILETETFDLILCDVVMPEMDGFTTLKRIRENPATKDFIVIMCTSVAEKDQVLAAIKAGANNYVLKPFKPEDLQKKIEETMAKHGK